MSREEVFSASLEYFLGPLLPFLRDESVTEIMVNGYDRVYVERDGRIEETDARFASADALLSAIHNVAQFVGRVIDEERPILDARLPDGSRVHAVIPPSARTGVYFTIRKFRRDILGLADFVRRGSLTPAAAEFLALCVKLRKNIVISGGTGTGKTTLLNALSAEVPAAERIVVIEDSSELRLRQRHVLYLEARPPDRRGRGAVSIRDLFRASLRMRPDRVIVGEVRGGEALDMVQAMLSGHSGSLTTVHANTATDALTRLETLCLMSDVQLPVYVSRAQVAGAVDLLVQLARFSEDGARRVVQIAEVLGLDDRERIQVADLYRWSLNEQTGQPALLHTGRRPSFSGQVRLHGLQRLVDQSRPLWDL
ncbi:MAG: CpaF family protein [Planctomycetota bacterium]|nr:MAG: CpaF family protein [Planctomycetota bacterium]